MPIPAYATRLVTSVDAAAARYARVSDADASRAPAPGKWSPKQILGHLIDSASNNHQRFVRAQLKDDLVFDGYEQERWVEVQRYDAAPWLQLIELWRLFNHHIARVMTQAPETERLRPRSPHNLDRIASYVFTASKPATLDDLMADYVVHLEKHLTQIDGILEAPVN